MLTSLYRIPKRFLFTALGPLAAASAWADVPAELYGGGGLGFSNVTVMSDSNDVCCYFSGYDEGDDDTALALHLGYRVGKHLAAEVGYVAGAPHWEEAFVYLPERNDVYNNFVDLDLQSLQFSALGILTIGDKWELYLKGGLAYWDADADQVLLRTSDGVVQRLSVSDSGTDLLFGAGVGLNPSPRWGLRLEFQSFGIDRHIINATGTTTFDSILFEVQFRPRADD